MSRHQRFSNTDEPILIFPSLERFGGDAADAFSDTPMVFECVGERSEAAAADPDDRASGKGTYGGLASWQVRRLKEFIEGALADRLTSEQLANRVRLSLRHFSRSFRASFGCSPHAYLTERRIEQAKRLMLSNETSLSEIALQCGFADQAHLSRQFHKQVGATPAAWRRRRRAA